MTRQEFFRPFVKAKPWEIVLCIAIGCIAIFYAQYAPSIGIASCFSFSCSLNTYLKNE